MHLEDVRGLERNASRPQVSAPTATTPLPRYWHLDAEAGFTRAVALIVLADQADQPVWKITTSPWRISTPCSWRPPRSPWC